MRCLSSNAKLISFRALTLRCVMSSRIEHRSLCLSWRSTTERLHTHKAVAAIQEVAMFRQLLLPESATTPRLLLSRLPLLRLTRSRKPRINGPRILFQGHLQPNRPQCYDWLRTVMHRTNHRAPCHPPLLQTWPHHPACRGKSLTITRARCRHSQMCRSPTLS